MSKITTKLQKIFGATGPTGILGQFGSLKAGAPLYTNDVETIQALNQYGDGIGSVLINGAPPAIQDINGLFYMISSQIAYLMQQGIPEWNAATTYYIGSFVTRPSASDGEIFISVADDNLNNDFSDTNYWMIYKSNKIKNISGTTNQHTITYDDYFVISQTSVPCSIYLPEATSLNKGRVIEIINLSSTTVAVTISALGTPYTSIDDQQYVYLGIDGFLSSCSSKFISTGTNWDSLDRLQLTYV